MNLSVLAKALGRKGGQARAKRLTARQKKKIASLGGRARAQSLEAARRMKVNFRYLEAIRELRREPPMARLQNFEGPLPGIYARAR